MLIALQCPTANFVKDKLLAHDIKDFYPILKNPVLLKSKGIASKVDETSV